MGALSFTVAYLRRHAVDERAEGPHPAAVLPVLRHHPLPVGPEPDDILIGMLRFGIAVVEDIAMKIRMLFAVLDHSPREFQKLRARRVQIPVIPGNFRILTIGVVVSLLRAAQLIAAGYHGRTLSEHQGTPEIALLPLAHFDDSRIVGRTFHAAAPRTVVVAAVAAIFAVGFVVFLLVAHEILQREPVV